VSEGGESRSGGLFDSLARFGQSLLSAVQTRLLLVADELEEQGALVARMAILWALAGICLLSAVRSSNICTSAAPRSARAARAL